MGLDALLEVGVVQEPELAVVDQFVLLALAQRLDGEPQLFLGLVHRAVVEVGDPGVDPEDGLCDGELVLARVELVVDEGAGQFGLADVPGGHGDLGLAVLVLPLPGVGAEGVEVGPEAGRGVLDGGEVGAGEGEQRAGGLGGDRGVVAGVGFQQRVLTEVVAVREHREGVLPAVRALGGPAEPAVGDEVDPVRGAAALDDDLAGRDVALDAAVREGGEDVGVLEAAQQGEFAEFAGITRTVAPCWTNSMRPSPTVWRRRRLTR